MFLDFQNSGRSKIIRIWIYVFRTVCVEKLPTEVKNQVHARQHVFGVDLRSVRIAVAAVRLDATTKKGRCARTPDTSADSFVILVRRTNSARSVRTVCRVVQRKRKRRGRRKFQGSASFQKLSIIRIKRQPLTRLRKKKSTRRNQVRQIIGW